MEILKNFIVIEGLDGAGTSTQTELLSNHIKGSFKTNEPTSGKIGSLIRNALKKNTILRNDTLVYLFIADRNEHLYADNGIVERCKRGEIVISDRYIFSTIAYQGLSCPMEELFELNSRFPLPEILFFLNTSPEVCQKRIEKRGETKELFEDISLQKKILDNYLKSISCYEKYGLKTYIIDGNMPADSILEEEIKILKENGLFNPK